MRTKLGEGAEPWKLAWNVLITSGHSNLSSDMMPNPLTVVIRGGTGQNFGTMIKDMQRAYQLALRWKVSQDDAYADRAVVFLDAWSSTMTTLTGDGDRFLAAGIYGYQWANVVDIMRTYPGWSAQGQARFQNLLLQQFYPLARQFLQTHNGSNITNHWANWDLCCIAAVMAIGICCDRRDIYNEGISYYKNGRGNGAAAHSVYVIHPGNLGQWQETARDQGHSTLGMSLCGSICEMAWSQGDDLYGHWNNRFLSGAEYVAACNLADANGSYAQLPFARYANRQGTFTAVSTAGRPHLRRIWEVIYNHYVNRKGLSAPYVSALAAKLRPEGRGTGDDPGMGTLTFSRDPIAVGAPPSGLTAYLVDGQVLLSWWGTAYATGYEVQRGAAASGPFTVLTTVGEERTHTDNPGNGTWHYRIVAVTPTGRLTGAEVRSVATTPQLRLHLPLNEGNGTSATDQSGNALHGRLVGGTSWGTGRTAGSSAVALDGTSGHVALPTGIMKDMADFTVAVWVYRQSASAGNARVFDIGSSDIAYLALLANTSTLRFASTGTTYFGEENVTSSVALGTGRWVHLAVTRRGNTVTLFVDGQTTGALADAPFAPHQLGATTQNWLGRAQYGSDPYFAGRMQDFRLYSGALTSVQIAALAQ
ncbi:alginate lyase family protein [Acidovorax sp. ACV01]|nr:alginate lyase family protein [Acidovorax sp. ACV01]